MIRSGQRKAVGHHERTLNAMWEQRRRWWFSHLLGDERGEARAAAEAARLHYKLRLDAGLPDSIIKAWEREWDDWFERKLRFLAKA